MISVRFDRGLFLPAHDLWLDPWDPKPRAFVSHAHADHIGAHAEIVASHGTARLMRERLPPGAQGRVEHLLELGETRTVFDLPITLLAAGHIFGSAQFFTETDAGSLLYTGDFKMRPGLSAEPIAWRHAETLIMETTFGLPKYRFPPTEEVLARMVAFCQEALEEGDVPVLLGYSLGKAQEILCALAAAGLQPMLHASVARMTGIYRELAPDFPSYEPYAAGQVAGKVLICPPSVVRSHLLRKIKNRRVAVLTGWALDASAPFRYGCDAAFPLSDHADYDDLIRYVELVRPRRVLTLHGFAEKFARDLRQRGFEAWAVGRENQMDLHLPIRRASVPAVAVLPSAVPSPFAAFAALGESIAATTSKLRKIELLAAFLLTLPPDDLPAAVLWLTGRAFPQNDPRVLQLGSAVIRRALLDATKIPESQLREISRRHADAGQTALEALTARTRPEPWTFAAIRALFEHLAQTRGPIAKADVLQTALAQMSAPEGQYVVKIITGDLRIGLKEGLVEEAIARACAIPLTEVRAAAMLLGDLGHTATLARANRLAEADLTPFQPIQLMLASPEPTATSLLARVQENGAEVAWLEDKFDGIRAQLHHVAAASSPPVVPAASPPRVELYSRDLKTITSQFPELAHAAQSLADSVIFDGEITAFEHGRALTFFDLQKRLGRKDSADFFLGTEIPVRFVVFDLLWHNGESLLKTPLAARRRRLESIALPAKFMRIDLLEARTTDEIERAFTAARARGNEGLIAKNPLSLYTPGRRGQAWLKLKKELATLDVVVVGAESGHGKRAGVLSDYTFAIRDDATGRLLTIGKAYSGLTDEEIDVLTEHFTEKTLRQRGSYREVEPDTVLEIAFDSVQPSTRHESGLALRFPRIKAIRRDKAASEIDTLAFARQLVGTVG